MGRNKKLRAAAKASLRAEAERRAAVRHVLQSGSSMPARGGLSGAQASAGAADAAARGDDAAPPLSAPKRARRIAPKLVAKTPSSPPPRERDSALVQTARRAAAAAASSRRRLNDFDDDFDDVDDDDDDDDDDDAFGSDSDEPLSSQSCRLAWARTAVSSAFAFARGKPASARAVVARRDTRVTHATLYPRHLDDDSVSSSSSEEEEAESSAGSSSESTSDAPPRAESLMLVAHQFVGDVRGVMHRLPGIALCWLSNETPASAHAPLDLALAAGEVVEFPCSTARTVRRAFERRRCRDGRGGIVRRIRLRRHVSSRRRIRRRRRRRRF